MKVSFEFSEQSEPKRDPSDPLKDQGSWAYGSTHVHVSTDLEDHNGCPTSSACSFISIRFVKQFAQLSKQPPVFLDLQLTKSEARALGSALMGCAAELVTKTHRVSHKDSGKTDASNQVGMFDGPYGIDALLEIVRDKADSGGSQMRQVRGFCKRFLEE
jgi:hypothetical protein